MSADAHSAELLEHYLQAEGAAGRVYAHARLLSRLAAVYASVAPAHLVAASKLVNFKSGLVVLHADSAAVAAKLRQLTPTLIGEIAGSGFACRGVQIKIKVAERLPPVVASGTVKPLSPQVCRQLSELSDSLPASPLRHALRELLTRSAKRE